MDIVETSEFLDLDIYREDNGKITVRVMGSHDLDWFEAEYFAPQAKFEVWLACLRKDIRKWLAVLGKMNPYQPIEELVDMMEEK